MPVTIDKLLGQPLLHSHSQSDVRLRTGTKATILAVSGQTGELAYATDTSEFYLYDGSDLKVAPLELQTEAQAPDMGAYDAGGLGISDKAGYYPDAITDKSLHTVKLLEYEATAAEGAIRTTTDGDFQVYLNGVWSDVVINFRLREDDNGNYELEHKPVGFDYWYEVMSGNIDTYTCMSGFPIVQQYKSSMGAHQRPITIDGGTF
jgi:hypothetical protein